MILLTSVQLIVRLIQVMLKMIQIIINVIQNKNKNKTNKAQSKENCRKAFWMMIKMNFKNYKGQSRNKSSLFKRKS